MNDLFEIAFPAVEGTAEFNRLTLRYASESPVQCFVTYVCGGAEATDDFYLEAGDNTFSGVIGAYLTGCTGSDVRRISVRVLDGKSCTFVLHGIMTERIEVFDSDTCYIENDRYRVGVRLIWGGGINCVIDKQCPVEGLTNLINQHDTGRLIQQSYYGTNGNDEYTAGTFMDHRWCYNPVQGGDRGNCHSRLIDVVRGDRSVYVKSQPMDWGNVGFMTPSYMENTYTLDADCIRVDNRFVDFSGWEHPCRAQEVPAFYTVSYLDAFTWYDGVNSWQNEPLSVRDDLEFWGLAEHVEDCTMKIREHSKETWCAWVSSADDYGIGLFVPGVDLLRAGRFCYNGSKNSAENPTNYVAPFMWLQIVSYRPIRYSYLLAAGHTAEIREKFRQNREFTDNASLRTGKNMRIPDDAPKYKTNRS